MAASVRRRQDDHSHALTGSPTTATSSRPATPAGASRTATDSGPAPIAASPAVDKWPASARLWTVAPAGHLPTAPSSRTTESTRSSAAHARSRGVTFGRETGDSFGSDLTAIASPATPQQDLHPEIGLRSPISGLAAQNVAGSRGCSMAHTCLRPACLKLRESQTLPKKI